MEARPRVCSQIRVWITVTGGMAKRVLRILGRRGLAQNRPATTLLAPPRFGTPNKNFS